MALPVFDQAHAYLGLPYSCVLRGCVPKKLMVYASEFADHFHDSRGFG